MPSRIGRESSAAHEKSHRRRALFIRASVHAEPDGFGSGARSCISDESGGSRAHQIGWRSRRGALARFFRRRMMARTCRAGRLNRCAARRRFSDGWCEPHHASAAGGRVAEHWTCDRPSRVGGYDFFIDRDRARSVSRCWSGSRHSLEHNPESHGSRRRSRRTCAFLSRLVLTILVNMLNLKFTRRRIHDRVLRQAIGLYVIACDMGVGRLKWRGVRWRTRS